MKRIAIIDREKCRAPEKCDYLCIKVCPPQKNNIKVFNILEDKKPSIDENTCIGCGLCVKKCPFNAIIIINLVKEPGNPVFQYGPNSFRLYRLPSPLEKGVVGIIGRNGMGKSTAIYLLSNLLKPNFGEFNKKFKDEEIIRSFRGSELQNYFEKLYSGKIKISYKPENLNLFVKFFGEYKVKDLLNKFPEEKVKEVINNFDLENILDRKVKDLSGGELQKISFIYSYLKEHNLLLVDEISNYLDIYERLRISEFLLNIKEKDSIILIDHDILLLDSVSDIIYVVYGVQRAYGVFSYPMGVKDGISQYLDGYLKRENIRIRDKKISFDVKAYKEIKSDVDLITWENLKIKLDSFELKSEKGSIKYKEIIGVMGRNGIGKTTFARALVKEIKYEGKIFPDEISISYKPQYLDKFLLDITVEEFLKSINKEYKEKYKEFLFELGISELLDREMKNLSGGELQTVVTFGSLIKDADLYILDEPLAFLDIEQRLKMTKFIREIIKMNEKSCLVIEHDILFLDYVSDRIILFHGIPGKYGEFTEPMENYKAINEFLKELGITMRRDEKTKVPRINKRDSLLDREQKIQNRYYY